MKKRLVLLTLCCVGCAHVPVFAPPDFASLPDKTKHPEADRLGLLDETQVRYFIDPLTQKLAAEVKEHYRVLQFRPGVYTWVTQHYSRTFAKVTGFEGQLVTPTGEVRPFKPEKKRDVASIGSSELFSDSRQIQWDVPVGPAGSVIEWETTTLISDPKPYVFSSWFGDTAPAQLIRHVVTVPNGWELEWLARQADAPIEMPPRIEPGPVETTYTWESKDIPAWKQEVWGASMRYEIPRVVTRLRKWKENGKDETAFESPAALSKWLYDEYQKQSDPAGDMRDLVASVLKGAPDEPKAKAKKLYEWVCKEVQYCAIEIGYGGWVPHAAKDVHSNRYGDCKDKANYLRALLEIAGIKSRTTMIDSHDGMARPFELPALGANFNHVILAIDLPGETIYADPTERTVPFGQLPPRDQDSTVLHIATAQAQPGKSPVSSAKDNTTDLQLVANVQPDGNAVGTFTLRLTGANASSLKYDLLRGDEKPTESLRDWLRVTGLKVTTVDTIDAAPFGEVTTVKGSFSYRSLVAVVPGGTTMLRLADFMPSAVPTMPDEPRRTPLIRRWLHEAVLTITVNLPGQATVSRLPGETKLDTPQALYGLSWSSPNKGAFTIKRQWATRQRITPTAEVAEVKKFFDQVHLAEADPALISFAAEKAP